MQRTCANAWCSKPFELTQDDLSLLEKVSPVISGIRFDLPPPTLCPNCRQQRRLTYRNERVFYHRPCAKTRKDVISIYAPDSPCTVYDQTA